MGHTFCGLPHNTEWTRCHDEKFVWNLNAHPRNVTWRMVKQEGGEQIMKKDERMAVLLWTWITVADPGFFFWGGGACQYMKIPTDLDPKPPFEEFWPRTPPPLKEFLDPPLDNQDSGKNRNKSCAKYLTSGIQQFKVVRTYSHPRYKIGDMTDFQVWENNVYRYV